MSLLIKMSLGVYMWISDVFFLKHESEVVLCVFMCMCGQFAYACESRLHPVWFLFSNLKKKIFYAFFLFFPFHLFLM